MLPTTDDILRDMVSLKMAPLWTICCVLFWVFLVILLINGELIYALTWVPFTTGISAMVVDMWHRRITGRRLIKF